MKAIIFILVSYGITSIVVYGSIFHSIIEKTKGWVNDLLSCPLCFGTWVGFLIWGVLAFFGIPSPVSEYYPLPVFLDFFACGMLSAGGVWLIENLKK